MYMVSTAVRHEGGSSQREHLLVWFLTLMFSFGVVVDV